MTKRPTSWAETVAGDTVRFESIEELNRQCNEFLAPVFEVWLAEHLRDLALASGIPLWMLWETPPDPLIFGRALYVPTGGA